MDADRLPGKGVRRCGIRRAELCDKRRLRAVWLNGVFLFGARLGRLADLFGLFIGCN